MPIRPSRSLVLVLLLAGVNLGAQEALRTAIQADRSYQARLPSPDRPANELRAGPVEFDVGAAFSAEWTDNVNITENDPQSDTSLRPQANVRALWPITDRARISLGLGVGYTVYLEGNRDDRLYLSPDSETAFDFMVKDVLITLYNRVDYSDDLAADGGVSSSQDYARLENTAGIRATWFLDDWQLQAGYAHYNSWSLSDDYQESDRASEQFFARVAYALAAESRVGIEFSGSISDYSQPIRDDFQTFSGGPFLEWAVTEDLDITLRGGYVRYAFDDRPTGPSLGTLDTYYAGINVGHRLTPAIAHNLSLTHEARVGINSDYEELFRAQYGIRWSLMDHATVSASFFYDHSTEPQLEFEEIYHRFGFSVGLEYELIRRLTANVSYRLTMRDSNISGQDYTQNTVTVGISYWF